jgi:glycosyltransferase involved in cell wall biosynthesis
MPQFSVVIPTRDRPELLGEAIASVLAQTVDDWELVVVDDASTPPASVPDDPRIRLVRLAEPQGPAGARNAGVRASTGRYLAFLDDDDLFVPVRLALAVPALEQAPIVVCGSRFADAPPRRNRILEGDVADTVLDDITPSLGVTVVARDHWVDLDERWRAVEDVDWWLRVAQQSATTTVAGIGTLIRPAPRSDRGYLGQRAEENLALLDAHADYFATHRRARAFRLKRAGLLALAAGERAAARRSFARSLLVRPRVETAWHLARATVPARVPAGGPA